MQVQLSAVAQARVDFAEFVDVGSDHPGARDVVQVVDCAFADVEKEAEGSVTPWKKSVSDMDGERKMEASILGGENKNVEGEYTFACAAGHRRFGSVVYF